MRNKWEEHFMKKVRNEASYKACCIAQRWGFSRSLFPLYSILMWAPSAGMFSHILWVFKFSSNGSFAFSSTFHKLVIMCPFLFSSQKSHQKRFPVWHHSKMFHHIPSFLLKSAKFKVKLCTKIFLKAFLCETHNLTSPVRLSLPCNLPT